MSCEQAFLVFLAKGKLGIRQWFVILYEKISEEFIPCMQCEKAFLVFLAKGKLG